MGRGGMLKISVPLLKKHMGEVGKALTSEESAEVLGMSVGATLEVLDYMEATGIVQRVKRRRNFYFLKDTYDEEIIEAMIQEAYERIKSETGRLDPAYRRSKYDTIIDRFLEGEDDLVRVDVVGMTHTYYLSFILTKRIKVRELGDRIESYTADKRVYLERARGDSN